MCQENAAKSVGSVQVSCLYESLKYASCNVGTQPFYSIFLARFLPFQREYSRWKEKKIWYRSFRALWAAKQVSRNFTSTSLCQNNLGLKKEWETRMNILGNDNPFPSPDKSCSYDGLKLSHGEKLTDASCAIVMECKNGFLQNKRCPSAPPVPHKCINPTLNVKRVLGECCEMSWICEMS